MILCSKLNYKFGLGGKYLENKDIWANEEDWVGRACNANVNPLNLWEARALQKV